VSVVVRPLRLGADDEPVLHEVACRRCGTAVGVRKNSLAQTTVQWLGDTSSCEELAARRSAGEHTARVSRCEALRESIEAAVEAGVVRVIE
jgi:hypothetical protein